jgi:hypothetical protein
MLLIPVPSWFFWLLAATFVVVLTAKVIEIHYHGRLLKLLGKLAKKK